MRRLIIWAVGHLLICSLSLAASKAEVTTKPITFAHSHNDYEQPRPLWNALDSGLCSVEADIYLVGRELLVAHEFFQVRPDRTLQRLYLDPLLQRARANGGAIQPGSHEFILLIDLKTSAQSTWPALRDVLSYYSEILTSFTDEGQTTRAVTVILSGERPTRELPKEKHRLAALDGRIEDLDSTAPVSLIPLISDNWTKLFKWKGKGDMPEAELARLKEIAAKIHARGRKLRFWAAPDTPHAWRTLIGAGVDYISTDHPAQIAQEFGGK